MKKQYIFEVALGIIGFGYIGITLVGIINQIGKTSNPQEFTAVSAFNVLTALMAWHWAIQWIKGLFDD